MALLRVRLRGKTVCEVNLTEDRSYVAGRKEDCDIVLQPEKGISREHFKVSFNGSWNVEVVSRYGEVIHNGEQVQQFQLEHGAMFTVPPYEFDFLNTVAEAPAYQEAPAMSGGENLPAVMGSAPDSFDGSDEKTMIGVAPTAAFAMLRRRRPRHCSSRAIVSRLSSVRSTTRARRWQSSRCRIAAPR